MVRSVGNRSWCYSACIVCGSKKYLGSHFPAKWYSRLYGNSKGHLEVVVKDGLSL